MESNSKSFLKKLSFDKNGLIPAIAQDWLDGAVLMMAWMNLESIQKTLDTGLIHYWSRSRNQLWKKGETSGHLQFLKGIRFDCDSDVLLLTIEQKGSVSCHTGARSCFYQSIEEESTKQMYKFKDHKTPPPADVCSELFNVIEGRLSNPEPKSYTNKLLEGGDNSILKKIGEESAEFVMACKDDNRNSIANEAADLIFHLQVALLNHEVSWRDVLYVLSKRQGAKRRG